MLPTNLRRLHPPFRLLQHPNDLLLTESALPHLLSSFGLLYPGRTLNYSGTVFGGQVSCPRATQQFLESRPGRFCREKIVLHPAHTNKLLAVRKGILNERTSPAAPSRIGSTSGAWN